MKILNRLRKLVVIALLGASVVATVLRFERQSVSDLR
jgi:hypothetical protein